MFRSACRKTILSFHWFYKNFLLKLSQVIQCLSSYSTGYTIEFSIMVISHERVLFLSLPSLKLPVWDCLHNSLQRKVKFKRKEKIKVWFVTVHHILHCLVFLAVHLHLISGCMSLHQESGSYNATKGGFCCSYIIISYEP